MSKFMEFYGVDIQGGREAVAPPLEVDRILYNIELKKDPGAGTPPRPDTKGWGTRVAWARFPPLEGADSVCYIQHKHIIPVPLRLARERHLWVHGAAGGDGSWPGSSKSWVG